MKPNENITTKWANVLFFVWLFQCFSIFSILKVMQLVCLVLEWQHVLNLKRLQIQNLSMLSRWSFAFTGKS